MSQFQYIIRYPIGESVNADGDMLDNAEHAQTIQRALLRGFSVSFPQNWEVGIINLADGHVHIMKGSGDELEPSTWGQENDGTAIVEVSPELLQL